MPGQAQEDAAEYRAGDEGHAPDHAEYPQRLTAPDGREAGADDRRRGREKPAGAEALQHAACVKHPRRLGDYQQQRAGGEQDDAGHVDHARTAPVGELGKQQRAEHLEQGVGVDQSGQLALLQGEFDLDHRQGRADDGQVQRAHQRAGEQQREQPADVGAFHDNPLGSDRGIVTRCQTPNLKPPLTGAALTRYCPQGSR